MNDEIGRNNEEIAHSILNLLKKEDPNGTFNSTILAYALVKDLIDKGKTGESNLNGVIKLLRMYRDCLIRDMKGRTIQ